MTTTELFGFTSEQACRITGLTQRQLRYWDKTGFFSPSVEGAQGRNYSRLYSFRNLVGLKTIALLRNTYRIPLQELRRVGQWLSASHEAPWSSLTLYLAGKKIFFEEASTHAILDAKTGRQATLPIALTKVAAKTERAVEALRRRQPVDIGQIRTHRNVVHNQPVVAGTRVPTSAIWNLHKEGYDVEAIIAEYPSLSKRDVSASIAFERRRHEKQAI